MAHRSEILMDITSANATITLQAEDIIPNPVILQNFSTDQSIAADEMVVSEARMGIDGGLAAGYTPQPVNLTLTLEANSPSQDYLFRLCEAMRSNRRIYEVTMTCDIPSMSKRYTWSRGVLVSGSTLPNPKKVLEPTTWKFTFATSTSESLS